MTCIYLPKHFMSTFPLPPPLYHSRFHFLFCCIPRNQNGTFKYIYVVGKSAAHTLFSCPVQVNWCFSINFHVVTLYLYSTILFGRTQPHPSKTVSQIKITSESSINRKHLGLVLFFTAVYMVTK